jgi:hypothetical protein
MLRVSTADDLAKQHQEAKIHREQKQAAEQLQKTAVAADMEALTLLSRSVSISMVSEATQDSGSRAATPAASAILQWGLSEGKDTDRSASLGERFAGALPVARKPSKIEMAGDALGGALGITLDLAETSVHTVANPDSQEAVLDLSAVANARERAQYRQLNPKAKPRTNLYPPTKLVYNAPVPTADQLPIKKFNTGFCSEADYYIYHVLADLYGYKVATMVSEASAAPQSNDVIIAQHEVAARSTGQSLVKFHKDGERNGYMFHDDVWIELYDEQEESFFYHNLATGISLPFGEAPPAYKEFNPGE